MQIALDEPSVPGTLVNALLAEGWELLPAMKYVTEFLEPWLISDKPEILFTTPQGRLFHLKRPNRDTHSSPSVFPVGTAIRS